MVEGEAAFVTYRCVAKEGKSFRNTEVFAFAGDRIRRIDVYFGATYENGVFVKQQGRGDGASWRSVAAWPSRPEAGNGRLAHGEGARMREAITSKIISPDMSVPQNPVRHVDERWFAGQQPAGQTDKRSETMRFMVIVKASKDTEAGVMPSTELLTAMGKFNEELVKAGMMEAGEGLHPTSKGARVKYQGGQGSASQRAVPADQRSRLPASG